METAEGGAGVVPSDFTTRPVTMPVLRSATSSVSVLPSPDNVADEVPANASPLRLAVAEMRPSGTPTTTYRPSGPVYVPALNEPETMSTCAPGSGVPLLVTTPSTVP